MAATEKPGEVNSGTELDGRPRWPLVPDESGMPRFFMNASDDELLEVKLFKLASGRDSECPLNENGRGAGKFRFDDASLTTGGFGCAGAVLGANALALVNVPAVPPGPGL